MPCWRCDWGTVDMQQLTVTRPRVNRLSSGMTTRESFSVATRQFMVRAVSHCLRTPPKIPQQQCSVPDAQSAALDVVCFVGSGGTNPQNESAYVVAIPPCVWGSAAEGLRPPPVIHLKSNLSCVKRANATYGHWGTMALWQMRGAYINHEHW